MAWRQPGDKPLSEPVILSLLTHICVTQTLLVNTSRTEITIPWEIWMRFENAILTPPPLDKVAAIWTDDIFKHIFF